MRIAILQYPVLWANKEENLRLACEHLRALRGKADLALLPEMFTTGFCTDQPELAEPVDGTTMRTLQTVADECELAIVGSFICCENERLYNRGFFVKPYESPDFIDKAHLYAHGGEDRFFTAGRERTIVEYMGVRFRLLICYDLRFPIWARQETDNLYDVLLVSANWPQARIHYWDALVPARAIENQCYICAANIVGEDNLDMHYNGHSVAYDSYLNPVVWFEDDEEGTKIADLDIDRLWHFRQVLPLWKDGDGYNLENKRTEC